MSDEIEIYECSITFHGRLIANATAGTRKDAKKKACRLAADHMKDNRRNYRRECRCRFASSTRVEPEVVIRRLGEVSTVTENHV